jgi:uncharacterized membrane protein
MELQKTLIYIFASIGVLDTIYLMYHSITKTEVYCLFFPKRWCHTVQHSKYSKTFGVPNGYWGFLMYGLVLLLFSLFLAGMIPLWPAQVIVGVGFLFSLYFLYIQAFVLRAFCTWCVLSAINFTVLAISVFLL